MKAEEIEDMTDEKHRAWEKAYEDLQAKADKLPQWKSLDENSKAKLFELVFTTADMRGDQLWREILLIVARNQRVE